MARLKLKLEKWVLILFCCGPETRGVIIHVYFRKRFGTAGHGLGPCNHFKCIGRMTGARLITVDVLSGHIGRTFPRVHANRIHPAVSSALSSSHSMLLIIISVNYHHQPLHNYIIMDHNHRTYEYLTRPSLILSVISHLPRLRPDFLLPPPLLLHPTGLIN